METFSRGTSSLDPWYVTGFSDGEASFTFSRSGRQLSLYYGVKLTDADRPLLEQLQRFFDAGRIYSVKARAPRPNSGHTKLAAYFRVSDRRGLERVVLHFDSYPLRGIKHRSYEVWRKMVVLKRSFRDYSRDDLADLARELSARSPRNG